MRSIFSSDIQIVEDAVNTTQYGIPPYMLGIFKKSENIFSDFCNYITKSYYGDNGNDLVIKGTANYKGWLIRVKPNTTYTCGPLDYRLILFDPNFKVIKRITSISDTDPTTFTTTDSTYWVSVTEKIGRDMSEWMMVEGTEYPNEYISGYPEIAYSIDTDTTQVRESHYSIYFGNVIKIYFSNDGICTMKIPENGRVLLKTTPSSYLPSAELTFSTPKWIGYNAIKKEWVTTNTAIGEIQYIIGWVNPGTKRIYLNAYYVIAKTIAFMGDSITAGVATTTVYHQYINQRYGYTCLNYGYGATGYYRQFTSYGSGLVGQGTPGKGVATTQETMFLPNNIVARLAELDPDIVNAIVIFGGTNDWGNSVTIENYISGIEQAFDYCRDNYPSIPVLVLTPLHRRGDTTPNSVGKTLREYVDILIDECKKYSIQYIDLMTVSGLYPDNDTNRDLFFNDSGLHPNAAGHKRIANAIGHILDAFVRYNDY